MKETAVLAIDLQNGMLDGSEIVFHKENLINNVKNIPELAYFLCIKSSVQHTGLMLPLF